MKWEYMTVEHKVDLDELNKLGSNGWELIVVVSPAHFVLHYFFKRQMSV
jgi:hypothetical protein